MPTDVARALGDLEGTVRSMAEQWRRQEEAAVAGRKALYEKFDTMTSQVSRIDARVGDVQQNVDVIKRDMDERVMPAIAAYTLDKDLDKAQRSWRADSGRMAWAVIMAGCTLIGFIIHELVQYFAKGGALPHFPLH